MDQNTKDFILGSLVFGIPIALAIISLIMAIIG
jgi:hypothetical protein